MCLCTTNCTWTQVTSIPSDFYYSLKQWIRLNDDPRPAPSLSSSTRLPKTKSKTQNTLKTTIKEVLSKMGGGSDDLGKKSRKLSSTEFKNRSSELVSNAPALSCHLSVPVTLPKYSGIILLKIQGKQEALMELLTFLANNGIRNRVNHHSRGRYDEIWESSSNP